MSKQIPQVPGLPFIGNLLDLRDGEYPLQALERLADKYGPIYSITNGANRRVVISSVELLDRLCNEKVFSKNASFGRRRRPGQHNDGLFGAPNNSDDWNIAHRVLMSAFGPLAIESLFDGMHDIVRQLANKWARQGASEPILVSDDFTRLTLDTIALCGMGYRFNSFYLQDQHPYVKAMVNNLAETQARGIRPAWATKLLEMTSAGAQFRADAELQHSIGMQIVEKRKEEGGRHTDLLDHMVHGKDPVTGEHMSDGLISANIQTFLVAGHETTSSLLSFTFFHLLKSPSAYLEAQKEVDQVVGQGPVKIEHLKQLKYINAVLRETLRLFPTAPAFSRTVDPNKTKGPADLGGYSVDEGVPVSAILGKIHRDKSVYGEDADEFRPERMLDEPFEKLPANAWKPFGTGTRACIGRAFAWQEALLAVAILLQRFNLKLDNPAYDLHLQVNLTMKPRDLYIRAETRHGIDATELDSMMNGGLQSKPKHKQTNGNSNSVSGSGSKPIQILYGSNTGTCEALAQRLASEARELDYSPKVEPMDYGVRTLSAAVPVVVITASYEGQPPDQAKRFVEWVSNLSSGDLEGVKYAVFGCGHHDWTSTFHRIPTLMDNELAKASAERLAPLGVTDVAKSQMFDDFDDWKDTQLWPTLDPEAFKSTSRKTRKLGLEITTNQRSSSLRQDVVEAEVLENVTLTDPSQPEKRHCRLKLPKRLSYTCGDYLAILPFNPPELVERVMKRFSLSPDSSLRIEPGTATTLPVDRWISARDLLAGYVELSQPVALKEIEQFRQLATSAGDRAELEDLVKLRSNSELPKKHTTAFDILERLPSVALQFGDFIAMLPPLRVRLYSISSSPLVDPSECTITYSMHQEASKTYRVGVTSSYLATLRAGDIASVSIVPGKPAFHLPSPSDQFKAPMIMVCAGTGIAPFRGFVQERAETMKQQGGLAPAPAALYIGCRSESEDRLYREELEGWERESAVSLRYAFSREPEKSAGCKYVQDRLLEDKANLVSLWEQGAKVYICGSNNLVAEVRKVLGKIIRDELEKRHGEQPDERVLKSIMEKLKTERVVADVFG